jgi:hypothetical protein
MSHVRSPRLLAVRKLLRADITRLEADGRSATRLMRARRPAAETGGVTRHARTWPAALTLFFLAALIPETVATFNSPPALLLARPAVLLFLSAFYGSVALLVREYIRRRGPGWTGVLLLGAAAGAVNEGIIAGTWYKVQYPGYAMIGRIDPAAAVGLTVFHALVSTVLPILLVELMFPDAAGVRWLRPAGVGACLVLLGATAATGFAPAADRGQKVVVLAAVAAAVAVALALPGRRARPASAAPHFRPVPGLGRLRLAGAAAMVSFYVMFAVVPGLVAAAIPPAGRGPWQLPLAIIMAGFFWVVVDVGRDWTSRGGWGRPQTLAVITGVLLPTIIASLVLPAGLRTLEPLVTIPVLGLLVWLRRRQRQEARLVAGGG